MMESKPVTSIKLSNRNFETRKAILRSLPRRLLREIAKANNIPIGHTESDTYINLAYSNIPLSVEIKGVG